MDTVKKSLGIAKKGLAMVGIAPRVGFNNSTTRMLRTYGNTQIQNLIIIRTPIQGAIDWLINTVSRGGWKQAKQKMGYDQMFHLALIATIPGAPPIVIEKNEIIHVGTKYRSTDKTQSLNVPLKGGETVNGLLEKAKDIMGVDKFFSYEGFTNNCQTFILSILKGSGLLTPEMTKFLYQDISEFAKKNEGSNLLANTVTYGAAIADRFLGNGKKKRKRRVKLIT